MDPTRSYQVQAMSNSLAFCALWVSSAHHLCPVLIQEAEIKCTKATAEHDTLKLRYDQESDRINADWCAPPHPLA